jgi:transposase
VHRPSAILYAELLFDQTIATWVRLHRAALEFLDGVRQRVVSDNLRAAIIHAALWDPRGPNPSKRSS